MIIKYTNFSDGIHNFEISESVNSLELDDNFVGDVQLNCKMDKSLNQIVLSCDLSVDSKFICDRCSDEYKKTLEKNFQIIYLFSQEHKVSDELNVKFLAPDEDKIVLDNDVVEFCNLAVPMKNLCREDCKGLCPHCGKNLNEGSCDCEDEKINPMWEPLQKLKGKLNN